MTDLPTVYEQGLEHLEPIFPQATKVLLDFYTELFKNSKEADPKQHTLHVLRSAFILQHAEGLTDAKLVEELGDPSKKAEFIDHVSVINERASMHGPYSVLVAQSEHSPRGR